MSLFRSCWLVCLTLIVIGCGQQKSVTSSGESTAEKVDAPKTEGAATTGQKKAVALVPAKADDVLSSAIHQLRPQNFGLNSSPDKPISLLNSWRAKRAEQLGTVEQAVPVQAPEGWFDSETEPRLAQARFDMADCVFIRDAMMFHTVAGYLSDRGKEELRRVGTVVDFVCRNITFWNDNEQALPLIPYLCAQLGRGSAEDRAWICVNILRQLRIDAVILYPKNTKESSDKWLLGVIVDKKVYLYDLFLALPVSSGSDDKNPATLDHVVAHPELLEGMAANGSYRLSADDLKDPDVFVVSEPNSWTNRMRNLEDAFPASDACVLSDSVVDNESRASLLQRVSAAGWPKEQLKLWPHPRRSREESLKVNEVFEREFQRLVIPTTVPIPFEQDKEGKVTYGAPERKLQLFRSDHMLGRFTESMQRYLIIRHLEVEPYPQELDRLNKLAAEDALYWTALCKIEVSDFKGAADLLGAYIKKYDRNGKWQYSARSLLAQVQAEQGQLDDALKTLERSSSNDPYQAGNALRVKRWNAAKTTK